MIPPPITIMVVPMPPASISEAHGVGVIEIENRAFAVRWCVRCRHRPAIVQSIRRLRLVRPIGPIRPICPILKIVVIVVMPPRPNHPLVRQVHLATAGRSLSGVNGALIGALHRIHPVAIIIGCLPR